MTKNRFSTLRLLSRDSDMPVLTGALAVSDYINAVYVDSYTRRNRFVVTQTPLASTVDDFWAMICQQQIRFTVSRLCELLSLSTKSAESLIGNTPGNTRHSLLKIVSRYRRSLRGESHTAVKIQNTLSLKNTIWRKSRKRVLVIMSSQNTVLRSGLILVV